MDLYFDLCIYWNFGYFNLYVIPVIHLFTECTSKSAIIAVG
jgi:hypothetical protein